MTKVDWLAADALLIPMINKGGVKYATFFSANGKQGPTVDQ
jgi:hypothetical protein